MKKKTTFDAAAWDEMMKLYNGWLSYLLTRLGEETVRVPVIDLRRALESLSCRVEREGEAYVIRLNPDREAGIREGDEADG